MRATLLSHERGVLVLRRWRRVHAVLLSGLRWRRRSAVVVGVPVEHLLAEGLRLAARQMERAEAGVRRVVERPVTAEQQQGVSKHDNRLHQRQTKH